MAAPKKAKTSELSVIVDELGQLEKEYALAVAPFEKKLPRIKALKETLQRACPAGAAQEWIVEGKRFGARLGPRAMDRSIDLPKLFKILGATKFIAFVCGVFAKYQSCGVSALDADQGDLVSEKQTGIRKLSTFEKGVPV